MRATFVQSLMELKRKSKLQGRPASSRDIAGVSEGYFAGAADRLARQKELQLREKGIATQERGLDIQESLGTERLGLDERLQAERIESGEKLHEERLELDRERLEAEKEAAKKAGRAQAGSTAGTLIGGGIGFAIGGPIGAGIGAGIGSFIGEAVSGCIIISACTSPDSYEVDITRQVRDRYLGPVTLAGYYTLARYIVPLIKRFPMVKKIVKRCLVNRLVDYGECLLKYKSVPEYRTSKIVTETFLGLCTGIGQKIMKLQEVK